jgi:hypothetical protein
MDKLAEDLQEDKETLKHCLERNQPQNGLWWEFDEKVLTVARILEHWGQFTDKSEVIDFFEKPYNFEDKMRFIIEEM